MLAGRRVRQRTTLVVIVGAAAVVAAGCGSLTTHPSDDVARIVETVPLGGLPEPPSGVVQPGVPDVSTTVPTTTQPPVPIEPPVGEHVDGSRLLLVGDTSLATLTERQDGGGCAALTELGWDVEIEAEFARYLVFADEVIDEVVVPEGSRAWDVVGVQFGQYVDTDAEQFGVDLDAVLDRLADRAVVLYTIAIGDDGDDASPPDPDEELDDDEQAAADQRALAAEINIEIRRRAQRRPNVVLADWAAVVSEGLPAGAPDDGAGDEDGSVFDYVDNDGIPTDDGTARLIALTIDVLGAAPGFVPVEVPTSTVADGSDSSTGGSPGGECVESVFTDDSAIVI